MALHRTIGQRSYSIARRRFLAGCGAVLLAGTAGCTAIVDGIADLALGDVNLFNETDAVLAGTVTVTDPAGETVLSEPFELPPASDEEGADEEDGVTAYEDVWTAPGEYEASVDLDGGSEVEGESAASPSVTIDDTDEEMLAVAFGMDGGDEPIEFTVGESLSGFAEN